MGIVKNHLLARKAIATKPTDKRCLHIRWNGADETVSIYQRCFGKAKLVGQVEVEGTTYRLMISQDTGDLIAIKGRTAPPPPKLRSPLRERFIEYFNHPFDAIEDKGEGWKTLKFPLDDGQIWKGWEAVDRLLGLGFGKTTRYALVDIDADSPYHNEEGLRKIRWALEDIGINRTILLRSSYSGGWHLYMGFPCPVPTFKLGCLLHSVMETAGLTIAPGELELFPNRKSYGGKDTNTIYNRHRLPLQPGTGAYLLDDDGFPYSSELGVFLDHLDDSAEANDIDLILEGCEAAYQSYRLAKSARKNSGQVTPFTPHNANARQWKKDLETAIATGWTAHHQSNDLLGQIAEYGRVFEGYDDEQALTKYVVKTAIAAPGFIPYCRHQREIQPWSARWAKSAMKHRYPYGSRKGGKFKPLGKGGLNNEEKHAECLARVSNTVADFDASGRDWPATIHARRKLVAGMANCSERTLIKPEYLPLWHPNHRENIIPDDDHHNAHAASDSAIQNDAGSHPDINCEVLRIGGFSEANFFSRPAYPESPHPAMTSISRTIPGSVFSTETPQTHTVSEIQLLKAKQPVPKPGDFVIEPDKPHRLLRLVSIDDGGIWCRCREVGKKNKGTIGKLCLLTELIPAPMAIADEDEDEYIRLISAGTNKPDVLADFSPPPEE